MPRSFFGTSSKSSITQLCRKRRKQRDDGGRGRESNERATMLAASNLSGEGRWSSECERKENQKKEDSGVLRLREKAKWGRGGRCCGVNGEENRARRRGEKKGKKEKERRGITKIRFLGSNTPKINIILNDFS